MTIKNSNYLKITVIIVVAMVFVIYGFWIGRYEVFPFDLMKGLTETNEEHMIRSDTFNYTALQRLYVDKIYLPEDNAYGGAMVSSGKDVIIVGRKGKLIAFDFKNFKKMNVNAPQVPLGLELLKDSGWLDREDFNPTKVRVNGAYADRKGEDEIDLYVSHHFYNGDCFVLKLSRIELKENKNGLEAQGGWDDIYKTTPCLYPDADLLDIKGRTFKRWIFGGHISGGRIIRYDEDHLLLSVGDHFYDGYDREAYAQDDDKSYGKFILINIKNKEHRNFAKGSRNAQGLYKDEDGTIWSTEHGPAGGDELNIIQDGKNYGWPKVTYGIQYNNNSWPMSENQGRHDQFTKPILAWVGSIAPSDLIRIEGDKFGLWKGDLLVSTLKDKNIHRLRPSSNNSRIIYDEEIEIGHPIRNIIELYDGSILLRTDDNYLILIDDGGAVYQDFNLETFLSNNEIARRFQELNNSGSKTPLNNENGALVFERSCGMCHSKRGEAFIGLSLDNLANRQVGSVEGFNYSKALENSSKVWNEKLLKDFIKSPQETFPGTNMVNVSLSDKEVNLISEYLLKN